MFNGVEQIKAWAKNATDGIKDDDTKMQMRNLAYKLADKGDWRGNISEAWKRHFPINELIRTGQLKDLYL